MKIIITKIKNKRKTIDMIFSIINLKFKLITIGKKEEGCLYLQILGFIKILAS